jgi:hypothetical protein
MGHYKNFIGAAMAAALFLSAPYVIKAGTGA